MTATYTLRDDGGVDVLNRGFDRAEGEWQQALGRAYFVDAQDVGHLKVSFFGPFYSSYVIFELDVEGYEYAYVSGPNREFLWLLARTPTVSEAVRQAFIDRASALGFPVDELIFPAPLLAAE